MDLNNNYFFFWQGPLSQWHPSLFKEGEQLFTCAEQYMMYQKAILFGDTFHATEILKARSPKMQKAYGKLVANFDPLVWDMHKEEIVYQGNYLKFSQNRDLLEYLLSTGDKTLVEASPYDHIWGIGLNAAVAAITPASQWPGQNLLGRILGLVRADLRKKYEA